MRIRATVAAVSGALALSAFVAPAAHAAGSAPNVTFSNMKVNKGHSMVVGTAKASFSATYTVTHPSSLKATDFATGPAIYRGTSVTSPSDLFVSDEPGTCTAVSSTVLNCKAALVFTVGADSDLTNSEAGSWSVGAVAAGKDGVKWVGGLGTTKVLRAAKLTADATPEPVKKGKTITVTGSLTRANWDTHKYGAYGSQSVKLQFRKKGSSTYTTLKTIKSSSTGALKTTTTATVDGYYRYSFAGTSTTPAVNATADYVDVQ
ncbi:hypothetical protein [Streptomyces shenzhenensis]|uniref:hypothetical protein n=1 Tax=Streptomyces shenzhenensis TaxID=943815 RepID=UPI001F2C63B3|nr:hypothetical protein [Streptomyces shenzhenensis]